MATVSIKDIAREVGVSTTTISFVLNGKAREKRISDDLSDRILQTAKRLNYRPNQIARGLRMGQSYSLGLIVEDISNPFFAHLAKHVEHEAEKAGYTVMFCNTENHDEKAKSLLYMLRHRQMDGFIIIPTKGMEEDVRKLSEEGKPVVLVDRYFPALDTCHVTVDNFEGARQAVQLLASRGYRRIGMVTIDSRQVQMEERERGYVSTITELIGAPEESHILRLPFDTDHDRSAQAVTRLLDRENGIDALFFTTNYLGTAGLEAVRRTGRSIPDGLGVVCFDDNILFRLGAPSVTVVSQPIQAIGQAAVRMTVDMIRNRGLEDRKLMLPPVVIERESTLRK